MISCHNCEIFLIVQYFAFSFNGNSWCIIGIQEWYKLSTERVLVSILTAAINTESKMKLEVCDSILTAKHMKNRAESTGKTGVLTL
jgi:hypothetical protein